MDDNKRREYNGSLLSMLMRRFIGESSFTEGMKKVMRRSSTRIKSTER